MGSIRTFVAAAVVMFGCDVGQPAGGDVLVGTWTGGMSVEEALLAPDAAGARWSVSRFSSLTLATAEEFALLGDSGRLTLVFAENRLVKVRFQPTALDGFLETLRRSSGLDLVGQEVVRRGRVEIQAWSAEEGEESVYWVDTSLEEQLGLASP